MNFHEYTKHLTDNENVPILGFLSWYNVPGSAELDFNFFNGVVEKYGAPIRKMTAPKSHDVFRRACNEAKILKVAGLDETFRNYTVRNAGHDDGFLFRSVVEEVVDAQDHSLGYREISKIIFARESGNITFNSMLDDQDIAIPYEDQVKNNINFYMASHKSLLPSIQVREAARIALEIGLVGVRVRPAGGIYFVSVSRADEIQSLMSVYNELPECSLHVLPLVDDLEQRQMLREAFEAESVDETTALIGEISALVKSGDKISAKKFLSFQRRYMDQVTKMEEYSGILEQGLDKSKAILEICDMQIMQLLNMSGD